MLAEEQIKQIKEQLLKQIEGFPSPQKENAKKQIEEMNAEQLEEFLIKNNLIKQEGEESLEKDVQQEAGKQQCIFCSISQGKSKSYILDENKSSLAVLDINPLGKGHTIVIPKSHASSDKIPSSALSLAKKIARIIKTKLKPENVEISTSNINGHAIINIIPFYKGEKPEKKQASQEDLIILQDKLKAIPKAKREKKLKAKEEKQEEKEALPKYPMRIP